MIAQKSQEIEDIVADSCLKVLVAEQRARDMKRLAVKSTQAEKAVISEQLSNWPLSFLPISRNKRMLVAACMRSN